jgi:hypothetical protein
VVGLTSYATSAVAAPLTVHGSATDDNNCLGSIPGVLASGISSRFLVSMSSDASPQPHGVGPVTLSNTTAEVRIGADFFQPGVDAGLIGDGFAMPTTVSVTLGGSNTVEAVNAFTQSMTTTLQVVGGVARPLAMALQLPDTVWHPVSAGADVFFREKSAQIVLTLDLSSSSVGEIVVHTSHCSPSSARPFIALGGSEETTSSGPTTSTFIGDPPIVNQTTTVGGDTTLPRTGSSSGYAVCFGLSCVAGGVLLIGRSRKSRLR